MTPENRHSHAESMMTEATSRLSSAEKNLAIEEWAVASTLSYYAMFHAASALLAARDIHRHRHQGVVSAFGKEFARSGDVAPELGRVISRAFETRLSCDYKVGFQQSEKDARAMVEKARAFLAAAEQRLKIEIDALEGRAGERGEPDAEES